MKNRTRLAAVAATTIAVIVGTAAPALAAPNPSPGVPGGVEAKMNTALGVVMYVVIAACVGGLFFAGGRLALAHRHGEAAEAGGHVVVVLVACIVIGSAAAVVNYMV